jgi:regulatory protein
MPLITEIRALGASRSEAKADRPPGDHEWRLVVLDDGRRLRVNIEQLARHKLEQGEAIDPHVLARLTADDVHLQAREAALRFLSTRPRSAAEVGERLARRRVPTATIRTVLAGLAAEGLLDDLAFARAWIARRTAKSHYGPRRIHWELRQKGVPQPTIDRAFTECGTARPGDAPPEEQVALALIRSRARRYRSLPPDRRARRIAALLERRGFASGTIVRVLRSMGRAESAEGLDG